MKVLSLVKSNKFLTLTVLAYAVLLIVNQPVATDAVSNSWYYVKEMLQILPVVFLLTGLLDVWVPKDIIIRYLGQGAGIKGILLSFLLGSISAGPIYAAFPICIMLLKKGATIRNIVIILSAWAVVKVPMLIVETKFLGLEFMLVRWALTVIAILIFSWITGRIVSRKDLPQNDELDPETGVSISTEFCMGCSLCTKIYPELFEMQGNKAHIKDGFDINIEKATEAEAACPVKAITVGK